MKKRQILERLSLSKVKLAVFASGSGSNFEALVHATSEGEVEAEIVLLICDEANPFVSNQKVIQRAEKLSIPSLVINPKSYKSKRKYEEVLLKKLQESQVDLIILAGYMRIVGKTLLQAFPNRILNIHPSLLPAYPGLDGIKSAYEAGEKVTGVTVHIVDEGMDTGPILDQVEVAIETSDTLESVEEKIHKVEHKLYPKVIQEYMNKLKESDEWHAL